MIPIPIAVIIAVACLVVGAFVGANIGVLVMCITSATRQPAGDRWE